jgi:hypothetical protein
MLAEDRISLDRAEDKHELKAIEDIRKHGVHILHVFDDKGSTSDFSYTVGLWHTHKHPEILISGLKESLRHSLLNHLNRLIGEGREFKGGQSSTDVIDNYRCYFQCLRKDQYKEYLGWDLWFYAGEDFDAVQMLWPSIHHIYPWDEKADESLKNAQEILTAIPARPS